jgi:hypothetical protein
MASNSEITVKYKAFGWIDGAAVKKLVKDGGESCCEEV